MAWKWEWGLGEAAAHRAATRLQAAARLLLVTMRKWMAYQVTTCA